jgi:hypothetical protein
MVVQNLKKYHISFLLYPLQLIIQNPAIGLYKNNATEKKKASLNTARINQSRVEQYFDGEILKLREFVNLVPDFAIFLKYRFK